MKQLKVIMIAVFSLPMLALAFYDGAAVAGAPIAQDDVATSYKKNTCAACHGPKAEKFFDLAKSDDEHAEIILKGKKAEKPPHMPGYEAKGITAEQAMALAKYMRALREPAD